MSIVYRSLRSRFTLLPRPQAKACSSRSLSIESRDSPLKTKSVHVSIFNKGFSYQPGARNTVVDAVSAAEISAQVATLRTILGRHKASLRRSAKLLVILKQQYDPSTRDKPSRSTEKKAGNLEVKKATKSRRENGSKANIVPPRILRSHWTSTSSS